MLFSSAARAQDADAGAAPEVPPSGVSLVDAGPPPAPVAPAPPPVVDAPPKPDKPPIAEKEKDKVKVTAAPGKGITVTAGDAFSMNIRARIQIRYQLRAQPEDQNGYQPVDQLVNIGTARLWWGGHVLTPKLQYMIQLAVAGADYRDAATSPIFDAYFDYKVHRDFSVMAGQYFVPFDRLRTVREWALQMADRPRPVGELTLDRDTGVTAYSDNFLGDKSPFAWRLGAFGGGGTNQVAGKRPGGLFVGRLELRPLGAIDDAIEGDLERRKEPGLAIGVAGALNVNTNRLRSTTGPTFTGGTTDYYHLAADVVFKWWGLAFQAEYLRKEAHGDTILSLSPTGSLVTEYTRAGEGWILQGSYTFDPPFEIVGRVTRLYSMGATDPALVQEEQRRGLEVGSGLNYYINGHRLKLQTDWIARMPPNADFDRADHVVHVQVDATF